MKKKICLSIAAVCIAAFYPARTSAAEEVKGKDVVAAGTVQTLTGILKPEGGHDWMLITPEGTYELHLGPDTYRASKNFIISEGEKAEVTGFVHEKHIAPITLKTEKAAITLRDEKGKSAWAGTEFSRGKKKNAPIQDP